jgi:hypothetical protein
MSTLEDMQIGFDRLDLVQTHMSSQRSNYENLGFKFFMGQNAQHKYVVDIEEDNLVEDRSDKKTML